jgi:hypothetical protein
VRELNSLHLRNKEDIRGIAYPRFPQIRSVPRANAEAPLKCPSQAALELPYIGHYEDQRSLRRVQCDVPSLH